MNQEKKKVDPKAAAEWIQEKIEGREIYIQKGRENKAERAVSVGNNKKIEKR